MNDQPDAVERRQETHRIEKLEQAMLDLCDVISAHSASFVQGWTYRETQEALARLAEIRASIRDA